MLPDRNNLQDSTHDSVRSSTVTSDQVQSHFVHVALHCHPVVCDCRCERRMELPAGHRQLLQITVVHVFFNLCPSETSSQPSRS